MSQYDGSNKIAFEYLVNRFARQRRRTVTRIFCNIASQMKAIIESSFSEDSQLFPVWTGNLRDATGIAVYSEGRCYAYTPVQSATGPQMVGNRVFPRVKKKTGEKKVVGRGMKVVGSRRLKTAIKAGVRDYPKGIWIVFFSATPYAVKVNEEGSPKGRGIGYADTLREWMMEMVSSQIKEAQYE